MLIGSQTRSAPWCTALCCRLRAWVQLWQMELGLMEKFFISLSLQPAPIFSALSLTNLFSWGYCSGHCVDPCLCHCSLDLGVCSNPAETQICNLEPRWYLTWRQHGHRHRLRPTVQAGRGIKYRPEKTSPAEFRGLSALLCFFQNRARRAHFLKVKDNTK